MAFSFSGHGLVSHILLTVLTLLAGVRAQSIVRINHGVLFREQGRVSSTSEHWIHTFTLEIPPDKIWETVDNMGCSNEFLLLKTPVCISMSLVSRQYNDMHRETANVLDQLYSEIFTIIPEGVDPLVVERGKRSFSFVADFFKSAFGFSTERDLQRVNKHVQFLGKNQNILSDEIVHMKSDFSSITMQLNHRLDSALDMFKSVQDEIETLTGHYERSLHMLYNTTAVMMSAFAARQHGTTHLLHSMGRFVTALEGLATGNLPASLISPTIITNTINEISTILNDKYPSFYVVHKSPHYYFNHPNYMFRREGNSIYISLKFPIGSRQTILSIYAFQTWPVPLNDSTSLATKLVSFPDYFAVSQDGLYYTELTSSVLATCTGDVYRHCPFEIPLTPLSEMTCVYALFSDNPPVISKMCDFDIVSGSLAPSLVELKPGNILVTNTTQLTKQCIDKPLSYLKGCSYCTIQLECRCSLQSQYQVISPRVMACHNFTGNTRLYPINLPFLRALFGPDILSEVSANDLWSKPYSPDIPDLQIYRAKIDDAIMADRKTSVRLSTAARAARQGQMIYQTRADAYLHQSEDLGITTRKDTFIYGLLSLAVFLVITVGVGLACAISKKWDARLP